MDDLDERAARLRGWEKSECGESWMKGRKWMRYVLGRKGSPKWSPSTDLNDAAELFRAAPQVVPLEVAHRASRWLRNQPIEKTLAHYYLDPATLTAAVVKAWEEHQQENE